MNEKTGRWIPLWPTEGRKCVSIRYTDRLAQAGIAASVGTVGHSHDNALAETIDV